MLNIHSKTFNPEILYVFDTLNKGPSSGNRHSHDFFELTILLKGESFYTIEDETHYLVEKTVLVFNPGIEHMEYTKEGMENVQIHIGLRHFNFVGYKRDYFPLESNIIHLENYKESFFDTCEEIIRERNEAKPGYELILKALVYKLIIYLFRDRTTKLNEDQSLILDHEKQELVNEIQLYIENHYSEDLSLEQIAQEFYTSSTTLSRLFKEFSADTPINYLINYRLEKAKNLIIDNPSLSIKEVAQNVGYDDPLYFSKLFKKKFGESPSFYGENDDKK